MYGLVGFFFKNCTDCTEFFSKIVRIVRISSENVRILYGFVQKSFGHPVDVLELVSNHFPKEWIQDPHQNETDPDNWLIVIYSENQKTVK